MSLSMDDANLNNNHIIPQENIRNSVHDSAPSIDSLDRKAPNVIETSDDIFMFVPIPLESKQIEKDFEKIDHKDSASPQPDSPGLTPGLQPRNESETKLLGASDTKKPVVESLMKPSSLEKCDSSSTIEIPSSIHDTSAPPTSALIKLWVVVILTMVLCIVLMVAAHLTHSLTLRVEAYHSLYNVIALAGSLLSIKLCRQPESIQNTFGWARTDVMSYLVSLIFLTSLCFSVVVEAVQTAAHVQHQDPMHYPEATILVCLAALAANAVVFALIGGYTQHQGSFLEVRVSGDVFVRKQVMQDSLQKGLKTLSARNYKSRPSCPDTATLREGYKDFLRDIAGLLLAILCAFIVMRSDTSLVSYYIDPALAVVSVIILTCLSYPFGKECGNILLQTIPGYIDVESFSERLQQSFPDIKNVHHLHIWSLTPGKVVATVHAVFSSTDAYRSISEPLAQFFVGEHITLVTLQPEFLSTTSPNKNKCCCSDHLLDNNGNSCDDNIMNTHGPHEHQHEDKHEHKHQHYQKHHHGHDQKHNHEYNHKHDHINGHNDKHDHVENKKPEQLDNNNENEQKYDHVYKNKQDLAHDHKHDQGLKIDLDDEIKQSLKNETKQIDCHARGHHPVDQHQKQFQTDHQQKQESSLDHLRTCPVIQKVISSAVADEKEGSQLQKNDIEKAENEEVASSKDIREKQMRIYEQTENSCTETVDISRKLVEGVTEDNCINVGTEDLNLENISSHYLRNEPYSNDDNEVTAGGSKNSSFALTSDDGVKMYNKYPNSTQKETTECVQVNGETRPSKTGHVLPSQTISYEQIVKSMSQSLAFVPSMEVSTETKNKDVPTENRISESNSDTISDQPQNISTVEEEKCESPIPRIEITSVASVESLIADTISDEEGEKLYTELQYDSQYPGDEHLESEAGIREASSEINLLNDSLDSEDGSDDLNNSTVSLNENVNMIAGIRRKSKDSCEYSLTRSVEKIAIPASDHSM